VLELVRDPRAQWLRDRQNRRDAAFRRVALVRARDSDCPTFRINVGLAEREELALTESERRPTSEERSPVLWDVLEHPAELLKFERTPRAPTSGRVEAFLASHRSPQPRSCLQGNQLASSLDFALKSTC